MQLFFVAFYEEMQLINSAANKSILKRFDMFGKLVLFRNMCVINTLAEAEQPKVGRNTCNNPFKIQKNRLQASLALIVKYVPKVLHNSEDQERQE